MQHEIWSTSPTHCDKATHELIIAVRCLCCVKLFPRPRLLESFSSVRMEPQWTQQDTAVIQIREKLGKKRCLSKVKHTSSCG